MAITISINGGEGGIRTHGRLRDTRSPGAPDRPLQHLSMPLQRRGWDSNPRDSSPTAFRERHLQPLGHLSSELKLYHDRYEVC
jgi:hypothetical protein